jgi:hypothetical protein
LARADIENGPVALDLFHDREPEGISIESRESINILHIKYDSGESDTHLAPSYTATDTSETARITVWKRTRPSRPARGKCSPARGLKGDLDV